LGRKIATININFGFKDVLVIFAGIFVFCYACDVFANNSDNKSHAVNQAVDPIVNYGEGEVKEFLMVAQRFADNHEYSEQEYNCKNYTRDLKKIADQLGFDVEQVVGCSNQSGNADCHTWLKLKVDFEPQHAGFMDYSKKYPYQSKKLR